MIFSFHMANSLMTLSVTGSAYAASRSLGACGDPILPRSPDAYVGCRISEPFGTGGGGSGSPTSGLRLRDLLRDLEADYPNLQSGAAGDLAGPYVRDPSPMKTMYLLLERDDLRAVTTIAFAIGRIKDPRIVEPFLMLLRDPRTGVRFRAMEGLENNKDPRAMDALIRVLGESPSIRSKTVQTLGRIGDVRALEPLIPYLRDPDSLVRGWTATALVQFGDPRVIKPLERAYEAERDELVAKPHMAAALRALRKNHP